ncbi:MAG: hypothetical protein J1F42_02050 [Lachnospiraceae bacterium]|nr:hypothetical protein [Lachnospiraceae bacterium]
MKKVNEILIVLIFILTAVLAATVGFRAYQIYEEDKLFAEEQEEAELAQVLARNQEAQNRVQEMQTEIQQLAENREELERFIAQIQNEESAGYDTMPDDFAEAESASASDDFTVSDNVSVSENAATPGDVFVSGNAYVSDNALVSGNAFVSGNGLVSGNASLSGNGLVSDNASLSGNSLVSDNVSLSGNTTVSGNDFVYGPDYMTLAKRRLLRTSLEETIEVNQADREIIADSTTDFSGLKIACLGDSITAAANLEKEEGYQQYAYPAILKDLLGAEEVYNLGIGGSSIGRYWSDAYVERYRDIPEDVDIIIVMGGTNDGFCVSDKEFGSLDERAYRTFCGDLDELMRGLRENYPDADIFFATPLPNILHDYLMRERDYLLPQQRFVDVILTLSQEYDYGVIDLYNSNILDSHDVDIVEDYVPDGVHANKEGYRIMAEHFAAELIRYYEDEDGQGLQTVQ